MTTRNRPGDARDAGKRATTLSSGKLPRMEHMHHPRAHLRDTRQNRRRSCALYDIQRRRGTPRPAKLLFFLYPLQLARVS